MRSSSFARSLLSVVSVACVFGLAACAAPHAATTTLTSAGATEQIAEPTPAPAEASESAAAEPTVAPEGGQLLCRTKRPLDGTTEVWVEPWEGDIAKGTLRRIGASGNTTNIRVKGERAGEMVILDDPNDKNTDLVTHAAVVRGKNGKQYIQLGDWQQPWSACD